MTGGRLTSTGSSTVYADLPQNLGKKVANSSTVKEPAPSGEHSAFSSSVSSFLLKWESKHPCSGAKILVISLLFDDEVITETFNGFFAKKTKSVNCITCISFI